MRKTPGVRADGSGSIRTSRTTRGAAAGAPSARRLKVGEELRHALAEVLALGGLRDPALEGRSITVSEVAVSPDLRRATAFVMPLGGVEVAAVMAGLDRAGPYLRREIARRVRLRFTPELVFAPDVGFQRGAEIDQLLLDVAPDDPPAPDHGA